MLENVNVRKPRWLMATFLLAAILSLLPSAAHAQPDDPIAAGYLRIYAGQPEEAVAHFERLRRQNTDALAPWFGALFAAVPRLDDDDTLEPEFERSLDAFIERASARYSRSSQDSEALFYLAQAHLLRGTFRFANDKGMWGAARDGAKSKRLTDEYLRRHPEHADAYLAAGLYNYFVDIAPNFVKVLRVILFLPAGNRAQGLDQLQRVANNGNLLAPFAQTVLAEIFATVESRPREAITIVEAFIKRFPANVDARLDLADMYMQPTVEQFARAEQELNTALSSSNGSSARQISERHSAILGLAGLRRVQWRIEDAIQLLNPAIVGAPANPKWVLPSLLVRRGNYKMLINDSTAADDARRVLSQPGLKTWHEAAERLLTSIDSRRRRNEGAVYAALIPGNQLVAEDRFDEAATFYKDAASRFGGDWQVRYRQAYLEFAQSRYDAAASGMQAIASASTSMPDWLKAAALLHLGYTHDLAGRRAEAVKLYERVVDSYEDDSSAAAARVALVAPYRGRG